MNTSSPTMKTDKRGSNIHEIWATRRESIVEKQKALGYRNYPSPDEMCIECNERRAKPKKRKCTYCIEKKQVLI